MELVFHLFLAILVPGIDHTSLRVPHVQDTDSAVKALAVLFCVLVQFTVDQVDRVLFISRPYSPFVNPYCIEVAASDHEVVTFLDDKLGIDLDDTAFSAARRNHQEVQHWADYSPSPYSSFFTLTES